MPLIFLYLLKLSIGLSVVYLLYRLLLQRLTFYQANRWYLLGYPLACFVIPLIDVGPLVHDAPKATVLSWLPALPLSTPIATPVGPDSWQWAGWTLMAGSGLLLGRLLLQYGSLRRIRKKAVPLRANGITVYQVSGTVMPFSFANGIYVNVHQHSPEELQEIIRHEYVHVKQRHSIDLLMGELLCIINWYNPFAWLLRHVIRQNLEFIADHTVLESGVDKKAYQYLLLKVVGEPRFHIANAFNFSSLKKRITMMNKIRSNPAQMLKFLIVLPLVALMLLAFRRQMQTTKSSARPPVQAARQDTLPPGDASVAPLPSSEATETAANDFVQRHPKVKRLAWGYVSHFKTTEAKAAVRFRTGPVLQVFLKNGTSDTYFIAHTDDLERFKAHYGEWPPVAPPPPPPPPPAVAPDAPNAPNAPEAPMPPPAAAPEVPAAATAPDMPAVTAPAAPPAPKAAKLPSYIKSLQLNANKAIVTLKSGSVETYDLDNITEKQAFRQKYGQWVPSPPPPPRPAKASAPSAYKLPLMPALPPQISQDGC